MCVQIFHGEDWCVTGVGAPPLDTQLHYNYRVELNDTQFVLLEVVWFPGFEKAKVIKIRKTSYSIGRLHFVGKNLTSKMVAWTKRLLHE